jgi:hypothetical protein
MPAKRATVSEAVVTCLAFCKDGPDPLEVVARFIDRLRENPQWSKEEIAEVRRRIEERL